MQQRKTTAGKDKPKCGLCGKTKKLIKTECCSQWICDDEDKYAVFSYARNSCSRNHRCFSLCAFHHAEKHTGDWKDCRECRNSFQTEMYVWYGTNEYNFEKLPNPPSYEPTKCSRCGTVIKLGTDGYSTKGNECLCEKCSWKDMEKINGRSLKKAAQGKSKPRNPRARS